SAVNTFDKDVVAKLSNSSVNATSTVRVTALNNTSIVSLADTETIVITTTVIDKGSVAFAGTFAANTVLGAVSASIEGSSVATTATGGVQVLAGDTSDIDARAQAGSTSTGGSISGATAGTAAVNAIGWKTPGLLTATIDTLLGTS